MQILDHRVPDSGCTSQYFLPLPPSPTEKGEGGIPLAREHKRFLKKVFDIWHLYAIVSV